MYYIKTIEILIVNFTNKLAAIWLRKFIEWRKNPFNETCKEALFSI